MSKPYAVLLKEIKTMQAHAEAVKAKEIVGVIARIKEAIKAYSITMAELYADSTVMARPTRSDSRGRAAPGPVKYRDANGNVWGGRGPRPLWLRNALASGKTLGDFEV